MGKAHSKKERNTHYNTFAQSAKQFANERKVCQQKYNESTFVTSRERCEECASVLVCKRKVQSVCVCECVIQRERECVCA